MKTLKKLIAVIMVAAMILGGAVISASAASEPPTFSYALKSQTNSTVTFEFSYVSGGFNSLDVQFVVSSNIGECQTIKNTSEFNDLCTEYSNQYHAVMAVSNPLTRMLSIVSTKTIDKATSICDITFAKKTADKVTSKDFKVVFSNCVVSSGDTNTDCTSTVVVFRGDADYITFDEEKISANYKSTKKISYKSSYSADQIKWESSNTKVATVDDQGNVKMTGKGTATITATGADGEASATCTVTVGYSSVQMFIIIVLFGWLWYI